MSRSPLTLFVALLGLLSSANAETPNPQLDGFREFADAARLEPDLERGAEFYRTCAACHGPDGGGTPDGEVPAIAGQHGSVLLKQLTDFRHDQRLDERMKHFSDRDHLPGAQALTDVAAYVASLPRFPPSADSIGDGSSLGEGASVYFRECERCHGPLGQGNLLLRRPRLAGQHYNYLLRQLADTAVGNRPGMDDAHVTRLKNLSPAQMRGVADYLSRVSPDLSPTSRK
ncbi:MAG TPA: c-type cytochrome [Steroidobacteraceae bacterium]|nr:c-type cytochrome [Steroidobacteraceae bacterium]